MNHYQPVISDVNVKNLVSVDNTVWSYVHPGCIVYQWDQKTRTIITKLDCSKLVPCSESLKSIAIEEHLSPTNCQVCCFYNANLIGILNLPYFVLLRMYFRKDL